MLEVSHKMSVSLKLHNVAVFVSWGQKIERGKVEKTMVCLLRVSTLLNCAWAGGHFSPC